MFAGNFEPAGWAQCDGRLLPISENETLFNLIGTTYGGDGQSTFALPDLQGRVPIHQGNGFILAETGGVESVTLTVNQVPAHSHQLQATPNGGSLLSPEGAVLAQAASSQAGIKAYGGAANLVPLNPATLQPVGGSQPHENCQPFLVINYIISLFGIFPPPS